MKRTKLLASLMMCVMCLSFLVVGVWAAAVSVNFNLNAGLKYYPEGIYVELSGQVYRGSSADNLTALTYDPRFTLEPITNYDNSTGEPSGNFPMESWEIGSIPFIPTEKFVKIEVTVVNHSEIAILGTPSILVDDNQEISTITNLSVTENKLDVAYIQAGDTAVYELILEVTDRAEINNTLSVSFDFSVPEVNYSYFTINFSNQITGLTQAYIDDSPEVLVIPAYSQTGEALTISTSTGSTTLSSLVSSILVIQEGYTLLSGNAFFNCTSLEKVYIPEGVTALPTNIFRGCTNLETAYLPASLTGINTFAFGYTSLKQVYFADPNGWRGYSSSTGTTYYTAEEISDPENAATIVLKHAAYSMSKS